ncbi:thermonuclease family protein [bacterium]|nr:thermonuclease family protein [bacterium]
MLKRGRFISIGILALALGAGGVVAADLGTVVRVVDGDTVEVAYESTVDTVRLIGIDAPEIDARQPRIAAAATRAKHRLTQLVLGEQVRMERDQFAGDRDRYGRLLRYLFLREDKNVAGALVGEGMAFAATGRDFRFREEFRTLEHHARSAKVGVWASTEETVVDSTAASEYIGTVATVCGPVASSRFVPRSSGQPTFLNLGAPYPNQSLTVVIWGRDRDRFGAPEKAYSGKTICVTGWIDTHKGIPQIAINDPQFVRTK